MCELGLWQSFVVAAASTPLSLLPLDNDDDDDAGAPRKWHELGTFTGRPAMEQS